MAADSAGVIFAPGTPKDYMEHWLNHYRSGLSGAGEPDRQFWEL
jgi:hypothetical protein